jgi:hypothetical protein
MICCIVILLTSTLQMRAVYWANLTVMRSIDRQEWVFDYHYYVQLADTLEYILKNLFICIMKEQYSDEGECTRRWWNGDQNMITVIQSQIQWLHIVDTPVAKWASTEHHWFLAFSVNQLQSGLVVVIHNQSIVCLARQTRTGYAPCTILTFSVNRASTIFGLASWVIQAALDHRYL